MKNYKLLKDLPFAKAGEIFEKRFMSTIKDNNEILLRPDSLSHPLFINGIENFNDWFEEIKTYYLIDGYGRIQEEDLWKTSIKDISKSIGNYFETEEEAQKHLEWLKARAVLLEDTNGFKPDWNNRDQAKYEVCYNGLLDCIIFNFVHLHCYNSIVFRTEEDVKASIDKHKKEWKIYLGVE